MLNGSQESYTEASLVEALRAYLVSGHLVVKNGKPTRHLVYFGDPEADILPEAELIISDEDLGTAGESRLDGPFDRSEGSESQHSAKGASISSRSLQMATCPGEVDGAD